MNGIHDIGGMQNFGAIPYERDEPVFHEAWEGRMVGMRFGTGALRLTTSLDQSRYLTETMDPALYLNAAYFERWLLNFEDSLISKGYLTAEELHARMQHYRDNPDAPVPMREDPELTERALAIRRSPSTLDHEPRFPARFKVGDTVRAKNYHPRGHTRLPRYARGKRGTIVRLLGIQELPDTKAHDQDPIPQQVYNVRFEGREVWGESAEPGTACHIDLWDSYLEPVD